MRPPSQPPQLDTMTSLAPRPPPNPTNNECAIVGSKWTLEEDHCLVKSWISVSTDPLIGADQKKSGFWTKVAYVYNQHAPSGVAKRTAKVINARWNRAAPLVSKWCACVAQTYRTNPSGTNEDDIIKRAQDRYAIMVGKPFNLLHWWVLLKDQPKWEACCDQSIEASSKQLRLNDSGAFSESDTPGTPNIPNSPTTPASEDTPPIEEVGGLIRPMGRKAAKRKAKERTLDPVLEVVTRELLTLRTTQTKNNTMWERYVIAQERKADAAQQAIKLRRMEYEDKILKMNIAEMCPEDQARYGLMQEEIRSRYRQPSCSSDVDLSLD